MSTQNSRVPVIGNGISLGFYTGSQYAGMRQATYLQSVLIAYGAKIGTTATGGCLNDIQTAIGITPDPEKSGLETSEIPLPSIKIGTLIIKY